jgi:hypothetical protein
MTTPNNTVAGLPEKWRGENGDYPESKQDCAAELEAALASPATSAGVVDDAMEALRWYAEQAELCRKLGRDGDAGRQALDADGGKRARAALSQHPAAPSVSPAVEGGLPELPPAKYPLTHIGSCIVDIYTANQMRAYGEQCRLATPERPGLDFEPDDHHSVADMANVGYALMEAIRRLRPGYVWSVSPAEIVGDLLNELDESEQLGSAGEAVAYTECTRDCDCVGYCKAGLEKPVHTPAAEQGDKRIREAWDGGRILQRALDHAQPEARGVEGMVAEMRNFADVADRCQLTEGNAPAAIRVWADQLERATPNPVRAEQPEGKWKLVPVEVTEAMLDAGEAYQTEDAHCSAALIYKAMLAAAPAAPVGVDEGAAKRLYNDYSGNHPTIHANRFPAWSELSEASKQEWRDKAAALAGKDGAK